MPITIHGAGSNKEALRTAVHNGTHEDSGMELMPLSRKSTDSEVPFNMLSLLSIRNQHG